MKVIIVYITIILNGPYYKIVKVLQYVKYLLLEKCCNALQYLCYCNFVAI